MVEKWRFVLIVNNFQLGEYNLTYPGGYTELISSPMLSLTVISAMLPELTAS